MAHQEPTFDLHQLTHEVVSATQEVVTVPFRLRTYRLIRKILIGFILVSIANVLFSYFFLTPKMLRINRDNQELVVRYRILQDRIRTAERRLDEIRHRDLYVYRPLFAADTVSVEGVGLPYPDAKYAALAGYEYSPLMTGTWRRLDGLARRLYETSLSLDELQQLSRNKEIMSLNVLFSNLWGILLHEWRGVDRRTAAVLVTGLLILIFSTVYPQLVK